MSQLDPSTTRLPAPPGEPGPTSRSSEGLRSTVLSVVLSTLFLALAVVPSAWAQSPPELVTEAETLFTVVASGQRFLLTPLDAEAGFAVMELENGEVTVDGRDLDRAELEELFDAELADLLLRLARYEPRDVEAARLEAAELEEAARLEEEARLAAEAAEAAEAAAAEAAAEEARALEERRLELEALELERQAELDELEAREEALLEAERGRGIRVRTENQFSFGSSLVIDEDEVAEEVAVVGGSLTVLGSVAGDAVVVGGSADIEGDVDGDVVAVGGSVDVGPDARIDGEVTSVGGEVRDPHGRIRGGTVQVAVGQLDFLDGIPWGTAVWQPDLDIDPMPRFWPWGEAFGSIVLAILLALWIVFLVLVAGRFVGGVSKRAEQEPWKAALVGLAVQILFFPTLFVVSMILTVSIIGIPLMVILVFVSILLLFLFFSLGYAAVASWAGRLLQRRFDWRDAGPYVAVLLGLILIQGWTILGEFLAPVGGPIQLTAWLLILLGLFVKFAAWTTGLGAVFLQGFSPQPATADGVALPPIPGSDPSYGAPEGIDQGYEASGFAEGDYDDSYADEDLSPGYAGLDDEDLSPGYSGYEGDDPESNSESYDHEEVGGEAYDPEVDGSSYDPEVDGSSYDPEVDGSSYDEHAVDEDVADEEAYDHEEVGGESYDAAVDDDASYGEASADDESYAAAPESYDPEEGDEAEDASDAEDGSDEDSDRRRDEPRD